MAERYEMIHFGTRYQEPTACGLFACGLTSEDGKLAGARWSNCWGWDADARGCPRAEASPDKRVTCLDCLKLMPTVIDRDIKPENVVPPLPKGEPALLPCTLCGGEAEFVPDRLEPRSDDDVYAMCKRCDLFAPLDDGKEPKGRAGQAAAWNRRPREAHLIAEGRRQERHAVVKWLRAMKLVPTFVRVLGNCIERGDHLTGQGDAP